MPHRVVRPRGVRRRDRRDPLVERQPRIDDDEAVALVEEPLELLARLLGKDDQRAVRQAVHQPVEERHLALVHVASRRQDDAQVLLRERLRSAGEDEREVLGEDERHEQAHEPGPAGGESAGASVRRVAVVADDARDELARLVGDVAAAVEDARDRRDRDAGLICDLADRHPMR